MNPNDYIYEVYDKVKSIRMGRDNAYFGTFLTEEDALNYVRWATTAGLFEGEVEIIKKEKH